MRFEVGQKVKYQNLIGTITAYHEKTADYKKVFEAEFLILSKTYSLIFDKDGYVKPFTHNTNQPKVEPQQG
jgi:hypothetical protein